MGTTRKTVMRWERGVTPDQAAQAAMGELFEVDPEMRVRTEWPNWLPVDPLGNVSAPWNLAGTIEALVETAEHAIMDRRHFVLLMGAELLLPVYNWRINPGPFVALQARGRHVSEALVSEIEKLVMIRGEMSQHGGGGMLNMLHSDLRYVTILLKNGTYSESIGRRLFGAAADLGMHAGWAAAEYERESAAQQYLFAALRAAAAAGDHARGVRIVGRLGMRACETDRLRDATQLMDAATAEAERKTPDVVQAIAWTYAGRAYAKAGDGATARRALAGASTRLGRATSGDAPAWSRWFDESWVAAETGRALCDLGDHKNGQKEIIAAIRSWAGAYPRDRIACLSVLAVSHLRTGDVDAACDSGTQVVDLLADQINSDRAQKLLRDFQKELAPFKDSASARDFTDYARSRLVAA
ncbi:hypothetical protein [Actinoallomurus sp. NPDC052274]|uniref:hypothetical protein n=1 Tax=Actinoallomurus sp. NPDC052274 TaxID=3155420 RepID=UPI003413183C